MGYGVGVSDVSGISVTVSELGSSEVVSGSVFSSLFPFIANMLTRKITKEGYSLKGDNPLMLGINLKDRKFVLYIMAVLLPWFYTELRIGLELLLVPGLYDPGYYMELEVENRELIIYPVAAMVSGTFFSFAAFGEEAGWRGYMMPKLMKLMGFLSFIQSIHYPLRGVEHKGKNIKKPNVNCSQGSTS